MSTDQAGKRVLGRIRLSHLTEESTSPERQREIQQQWADTHGHTIIGWAVDLDVSRSVDPFETPELGKWFRPERRDLWDIVACWKLDRVATGSIYLNKVMAWCQDNGKTLVSVTENFDLSTWVGRMIANMIAGVAEGELEAIKERTAFSQRKVRKLGRMHNGSTSYGYDRVKLKAGEIIWEDVKAETTGWYRVHNPEEVKVIRLRIMPKLLARKSANIIATSLNKEGIPTKFGKRTRKGVPNSGQWDSTVIRRLMQSPALMGFAVHKDKIVTDDDGLPIQVAEPILTQEEFNQVQKALNERSIRQSPRDASTNLLTSGRAECIYCHANLYRGAHKDRGITYFRHAQGTECVDYMSVREEVLYKFAESMFLEHVGDIPRTERVFIPASSNTQELDKVRVALDTVRQENELGLYDGSQQDYLDRVKRLVTRKRKLEEEPERPSRYEHRSLGETYGEAWARMDTEERRGLMIDADFKVYAGGPTHLGYYTPLDIRSRVANEGQGLPTEAEALAEYEAWQSDQ